MSKITIETEKDDYTGGETVKGKVIVELDEAVPARGVRIHFTGYERAVLPQGVGRNHVNYFETRELFDEEQTLFGKPALELGALIKDALKGIFSKEAFETLKAGTHKYPFTFQLPAKLPGDYESPRGSSIRYELNAYVDIPLRIDLKTTKKLTVYEPYDCDVGETVAADSKKSFMFEADAPLELSMGLERSTYFPGDKGSCRLEIRNESSKTIDAIQLFVRQNELVTAEGIPGHHRFEIPVAEYQEHEVEQGKTAEFKLNFELPADVYATIESAELIKVSYELVANLDIPWAADLETTVPIVFIEKAGAPSGGIGAK